jgi:hypothetical protein
LHDCNAVKKSSNLSTEHNKINWQAAKSLLEVLATDGIQINEIIQTLTQLHHLS